MKNLCLLLLFFMGLSTMKAGRVDTLEIYSPSMRKAIRCLIITPDQYSVQGRPYPVLYLLHGWSGNYSGWLKDAPQLQQHADRYQMLIVCPDGGYDSWYLDSAVDTSSQYETHITQEVIPFGASGSMAGGLDLCPFKKNNWDLQGVLGNPNTNWSTWEASSVVNLIPQIKKDSLQIIIDCGVDDFFLKTNRDMHQGLLKAGIAHEYTERPGGHSGAYWGSAVDFQVLFFDKFFRRQD